MTTKEVKKLIYFLRMYGLTYDEICFLLILMG